MIEHLFGSKTRVKLLHLFYANAGRSFYVREITRKINEQINSVRRELSNLLSIGIIKSDSSGNRLYYEVNQTYPHYDALRSMFTGLSKRKEATVNEGGGDDLASKLRACGSVQLAILTGSFVRNESLPVDILIVGDVNRSSLAKVIFELENEEGHELRYAVFSADEFAYRQDLNDRFISSVMNSKKSVIIDELSKEKATAKTK